MESQLTPENAQVLLDVSQQTIFLMGGSFMLGSFFTLLLLLILDFVRRNRADAQS